MMVLYSFSLIYLQVWLFHDGLHCQNLNYQTAILSAAQAISISFHESRNMLDAVVVYFGLAFATPPPREIFGVNALRGKQQQLGSPNLQDIFIGG